LRDENDDDSFLLDPTLAEILIPLLNNTSRWAKINRAADLKK
jgi:hypothetical protein